MTTDNLAEFESRLNDDLQAIAALFAEVGHDGSAIRVLGFKRLILSEISEIRDASINNVEVDARVVNGENEPVSESET